MSMRTSRSMTTPSPGILAEGTKRSRRASRKTARFAEGAETDGVLCSTEDVSSEISKTEMMGSLGSMTSLNSSFASMNSTRSNNRSSKRSASPNSSRKQKQFAAIADDLATTGQLAEDPAEDQEEIIRTKKDDANSVSSFSTNSSSAQDDMTEQIAELVRGFRVLGDNGELLEEEDLIQNVVQSVSHAIRAMAPVAILVMNSQCLVMDMNPKAEELFGKAREEVVGKNIKVILPDDVAPKHDEYVGNYLERYKEKKGPPRSSIVGNKGGHEVLCQRFENGAKVKFNAEIRVRGIPHPAGKHLPPLFFIGYIEDVTSRRQLAQALEVNRFIREKGDSALVIMDDYGKILDFNGAAAKMFRYDPAFVIGHNVKKLMPPDIGAVHDEMLTRFRERVSNGMLHTSPVVGKPRELFGYRPMYDEPGCEKFKLELRVEAFSGGKVLVAFIRDLESVSNPSDFMEKVTRDTFPQHTVDRLMREEPVFDKMENVTVLFSDVASFSAKSATMEPEDVFNYVDGMVCAFDELGYDMEKIKTIGDGYMAYFMSADDAIYTSLRILEWCNQNNVDIRIGLHTGDVVAGVVGKVRRTFDMWGDTVNMAKRMEDTGLKGQLHVSEETFNCIEDDRLCDIFANFDSVVKGKPRVASLITELPDGELTPEVLSLLAERDLEERQAQAQQNMRQQRQQTYI